MWLVVCLETAETRKVCKVSFPASLQLPYSFPFKVPLASASITRGSHHILLFLTPCSNKRAIRPFLKSILRVRTSLRRRQPGPSNSRYQNLPASLQHVAPHGCASSSSRSPNAAVPHSQDPHSLFRVVAANTLNSLPTSSHALANPVQFVLDLLLH